EGETTEEDQAGDVENERIPEIEGAVQELETGRQQMVDLQGHRPQEEDDEAVVDGGVHDPGAGITHQGLHAHTLGETVDPLLQMSGATIGTTLRPAFGAPGEEVEHQPYEHGD